MPTTFDLAVILHEGFKTKSDDLTNAKAWFMDSFLVPQYDELLR